MNDINYYHLTHPQKRVWYIDRLNTGSPIHNIGGILKIFGKIDLQKLERAIRILIEQNDSLRIRFIERNGEPLQYISEYKETDTIDYKDFSSENNSIEHFNSWTKKVFQENFDLINNKLYYFCIYKLTEDEYGFLLKMHHLISDGWTMNLIEAQINEAYTQLMNMESEVNLDTSSYIGFIEKEKKYLTSNRFDKNKNFWNEKFNDISDDLLAHSTNHLEGERRNFRINKETSLKIKKFIQEKGISLNSFFVAMKLIYLHKTKSIDDIVIGIPVLNRSGKTDKKTMGMYTSSMPFRFQFKPNMNLEQMMEGVESDFRACFFNQKYPYDLLTKDLDLKKKGNDGLFNISVNYYNTAFSKQISNIPIMVEEIYSGHQIYSFHMIIKEWSDQEHIDLCMDYKLSEYSEEEINSIYKYMMNLINKTLRNGNEFIKDLDLLDREEYQNRIEFFNDTEKEYPRDKTIIDLIEEQAKENPHQTALIMDGEHLNYLELNRKINQLSNFLVKKNIKKNDIVAVIIDHSFELVVSILAIMKIGAAYIPIDPKYPVQRINYMLKDSKTKLLITDKNMKDVVEQDITMVLVHDHNIQLENDRFLNSSHSDCLAYVIYTSGSTGNPKGVMVTHKALMNYAWWASQYYLNESQEIFAFYSSISFDLTVTSIFTPLISGNAIAIYHDDGNEFILYKILQDNKATVIKLTPSHLTLLKDRPNQESSIRRFVVGGENLPVKLAKHITDRFNGNIEIYNEYGPTETTVGCMIYKFDTVNDSEGSVPIGGPIDNVQIYILDKHLNAVPTTGIGELYISGDSVAQGYLNKTDLTNERFMDNPFLPEQTMYKTGDLARWLPNGNIEYLGRIDNQVKINGHRIELGEIENKIVEITQIENVIVKDQEDERGNQILCSYIVGQKSYNDREIKKMLSEHIPKYMIPSHFIYINEVSLTSNGKVDFNQLPVIESNKNEFIEYRTEIEEKFVKIASEILGIDKISMNDNFYQLGGDSIKAIQLTSRLNKMNLNLKVQDVMEHEIIEEIAACIENNDQKKMIDQKVETGEVMSTPIIEWFFMQEFEDINYYNQSVLLELSKDISLLTINKALNQIIKHHDTLRMNYNLETKSLYYNNKILEQPISLQYHDLSQYDIFERNERIKRLSEEVKGSFSLDNECFFNGCIFKIEEDKQLLLLTAHHLLIDGVSWRIVLEDLNILLNQQGDMKDLALPLKTYSYKEWANELNKYSEQSFSEEKEFWGNILNKQSLFPVDYDTGPDLIANAKSIYGELSKEMVSQLTVKIREMYGMEFNELLIASLVLTIKKTTKLDDITLEVERHGREPISDDMDVSRTMGWFTSIYPIHFKISEIDFQSNLKYLKETLRSIPNHGFNFGILKYLKKELNHSNQKLVRFNYLGDFDNLLDSKLLKVSNFDHGSDIGTKNKRSSIIDVDAMILNGKLRMNISYSNNRFKDDTMTLFQETYIEILKDILEHCLHKKNKEYTPSDFEALDISQDDLDMLLN
ncbi:non-ribosomal peptide synthetase [Chengkuizengella marina]|nr:non-ribosomal peptide synthetase [Chengkuizengella marina]